MGYSQQYQSLQDAYDDQIEKANRHVTTANKPGKNRPRWFAAIRSLEDVMPIVQTLNYDPQPIVDKAHEAFHYLLSQ
jgi:hypothetical protein